MNGVPICGRCYNAARAAQQQPSPSGAAGSQTPTAQQPATGGPRAEQVLSVLPAPVPFSQAAVPIEQVFEPSAEPEPEHSEQPSSAATSRESARRAGAVSPPSGADPQRVYVVGGIAAAAAFLVVLLGYYLIWGGPSTQRPTPQAPVTQAPSLPPPLTPDTAAPSLPAPLSPDANPDPRTRLLLDQEFESIRKIPDQEKDRKVAALNGFIEKCTDTIIRARAKTLLDALAGPPPKLPESPLEPTTQALDGKSSGLEAEYFNGCELAAGQSITRQTDLLISLNTTNPRPPGVPRQQFSARWSGYLYIEKAGLYTLAVVSDDGARVYLGDQLIIDFWGIHPVGRAEGKRTLKAGYYKLKVEYFQGGGEGEISLRWALKGGFDERIITADNLFHVEK